MKNKILMMIPLCVFTFGLSAHAEDAKDTRIIAPGNHVVTSLQKCLDQLDAADAIDIRKNYIKPWQECQGRLEAKKRQEQSAKAGENGDETTAKTAETPRNYVRVQKTPYKGGKVPETEPVDTEKKTAKP